MLEYSTTSRKHVYADYRAREEGSSSRHLAEGEWAVGRLAYNHLT